MKRFCLLLGALSLFFSGCSLADSLQQTFGRWSNIGEGPADPRYVDERVYKQEKDEQDRMRAEQKNATVVNNVAPSGG